MTRPGQPPPPGVVGVGVDAIEIERMERAIARTPALVGRLFTPIELAHCTSRCGRLRFAGLAARFAAKEAVSKALGSGLSGFGFRDVEVRNNADGRPEVLLHAGAGARARALGVGAVHLSLSTTREIAVAHVVAAAS